MTKPFRLTAPRQSPEASIHRSTWKPVVGFEGLYEVSDLGELRSLDHYVEQNSRWGKQRRIQRGRLLRAKPMQGGYLGVCLYIKGKPFYRHVAHLVAAAFIGERPDGYDVCHNDGNRQNNEAVNLRYDTRKANHADMLAHGTRLRGSDRYNAKASEEAVRDIRASRPHTTYAELARRHGLPFAVVAQIAQRRTWRHVQ